MSSWPLLGAVPRVDGVVDFRVWAPRAATVAVRTDGRDHELAATDDCVFEGPRGPHPYGQVFVGKEAVRAAFAGRFSTIPDVRYTQDSHFVCADRGVSEWTISGTTLDGDRIEARGCDIWTFAGNKIALKNSFWKMRTVAQPEPVTA